MKKEETLLFLILTSIACNQSHPNNMAMGAADRQITVAKGVQQQQAPPTLSDTSFRLQILVPLRYYGRSVRILYIRYNKPS